LNCWKIKGSRDFATQEKSNIPDFHRAQEVIVIELPPISGFKSPGST